MLHTRTTNTHSFRSLFRYGLRLRKFFVSKFIEITIMVNGYVCVWFTFIFRCAFYTANLNMSLFLNISQSFLIIHHLLFALLRDLPPNHWKFRTKRNSTLETGIAWGQSHLVPFSSRNLIDPNHGELPRCVYVLAKGDCLTATLAIAISHSSPRKLRTFSKYNFIYRKYYQLFSIHLS